MTTPDNPNREKPQGGSRSDPRAPVGSDVFDADDSALETFTATALFESAGRRPATAPPAQPTAPSAPKPAAPAKPSLSTPAGQSRALAETIVNSFLDRLRVEAAKHGDHLSTANIETLRYEFERKADALQAVFQKSFEDYVHARERAFWDNAREFPFDRQMVDTFAGLFPSPGAGLGENALSRRMLPGFFVALTLMISAEMLEDFQRRAREQVDALKAAKGEAFNWQDVEASPEIAEIVIEALVLIVLYFDPPEKRRHWFIAMVNDHLGPANVDREGAGAEAWQMTDSHFDAFVGALFTPLHQALATESGRFRITRRFGAEVCANLPVVLEKLPGGGPAAR